MMMLLLVHVPANASVPQDLEALTEQGHFGEAYVFAKKWQDDYEGDPVFDLYFGLAAMEVGHFAEAILAFDRILIMNPRHYRARLEMGRGYFLLADYIQARKQFDYVLASLPPETVRRRIQFYLDAITAREKSQDTATSLALFTRAGYSSNINSATTDDFTDDILGIKNLEISKDNQAKESRFSEVEARWSVTKPITTKRAQFLTASYKHLANQQTDEFNTDTASLGVGYIFRSGISQYRVPLTYQIIALDDEMLRYSVSLGIDANRPIGARLDWVNFGVVSMQRYKSASERDTNLLMLGTGFSYTGKNLPMRLFGSVLIAEEHERDVAVNGRTYGGLRLSGEYLLNTRSTLFLNNTIQLSTYHDSGFFEDNREDWLYDTVLGWRWRYSKNIAMTSEINYTDNDSNTVLYDYHRSKFQVGFQYVLD